MSSSFTSPKFFFPTCPSSPPASMGPVCFSAYLTGCYRYSEALRHQLTPGEASFSDGKWTKRAERWSGSSVGAGELEDFCMDWFSVRMDTKPPRWSDFSCVYTCLPIKTGSLFNTNIKAITVLNFLDVFSENSYKLPFDVALISFLLHVRSLS